MLDYGGDICLFEKDQKLLICILHDIGKTVHYIKIWDQYSPTQLPCLVIVSSVTPALGCSSLTL